MKLHKKLLSLLLALCLVLVFVPAIGTQAAETDSVEDAFDPYVFVWNAPYRKPDTVVEGLPEYYIPYAVEYTHSTPHEVYLSRPEGMLPQLTEVKMFNLVNYSELIPNQADAPEGAYASYPAFCSDCETYLDYGASYRRLNLEDGYFNYDEDGNYLGAERARKVRAILHNTYMAVPDIELIQSRANAYLQETYGQTAVLVEDLTGAEVLSASQAAIWSITNVRDFSDPYCRTISGKPEEFLNVLEPLGVVDMTEGQRPQTGANINGIYEYLINLPGEDSQDVVITENSVELTGLVKHGFGNDSRLTAFVKVDGTIDNDDNLVLKASVAGQNREFALGQNPELVPDAEGVYTLTIEGVDDTALLANPNLELQLSGTQTVHDVCFFESKPEGDKTARKASQNLVGYSGGSAPVQSSASFDVTNLTETTQITKVDGTSGKPLTGVAFDLYADTGDNAVLLGSYLTDENGQIRVDMLDNGYACYFVETGALPGYEGTDGQFSGGDVIENHWTSGSLTVSKKLVNSAEAQEGERFTFKLTLDMSTAPLTQNGIQWMDQAYLMGLPVCRTELEWTAGDDGSISATFTLEADEQITISGIPTGTTYTLEEQLDAPDGYIVTTLTDNVTEGTGTLVSGTVAEQNAVVFTNTVVEPIPETGDSESWYLLAVLMLLGGVVLVTKRRFL